MTKANTESDGKVDLHPLNVGNTEGPLGSSPTSVLPTFALLGRVMETAILEESNATYDDGKSKIQHIRQAIYLIK